MLGLPKLYGKDKGLILVSFIYMLYIIFPLFVDLTHIPVFVPALAVVGYVSVVYPFVYKFRPMRWLLVYISLLFLYSIMGKPIIINGVNSEQPFLWRITIESAWIMPSVMIACILQMRNNKTLYRIFGYGFLLVLTMSFLYILPLIVSSQNILRLSEYENEVSRPLGLPGYDLMHSYTLVLVPLCYMLRLEQNMKRRFLIMGLILLFFYVITQTAVTTSLMVSIFIFLFMVIYSEKNVNATVFGVLLMGGLIYALYFAGFFLWLVDSLMPIFDGTAVAVKLQDFHDSMMLGKIQGDSITGRMDYHQISKDAFFENPFFGSGQAGGHSKILDLLGCMGIVIFIPYFKIVWGTMKMQIHGLKEQLTSAFIVLGYFAAFIYLYEKGIFGAPGYLTMIVIVPAIIKAYESKKL